MTRISPVRGAALLVTSLVAGLAGTVAPATAATAIPTTGATTVAVARAASPHMTTLTFAVHGCDGCKIQPLQYIAGTQKDWEGKRKTVKDGTVSWTVNSKHTHGMSVWIRGPWEGKDGGTTGYVANVVFRYDHEKVGSTVTREDVRSKRKGTGCWAGTAADAVTVPLEVRRVMVQGNTGRTAGTLAWTRVTQDWWTPMLRTHKGILGSQDVMPCNQP